MEQLTLPDRAATARNPAVDSPRIRSGRVPRRRTIRCSGVPAAAGSAGRARKGQRAYGIRCIHDADAARLTGQTLTCADLLRDEKLLGRCLWTTRRRRSAPAVALDAGPAALGHPELRDTDAAGAAALLGEDPHVRLDRALRAVAERWAQAIASMVAPHDDAAGERHPRRRSGTCSTPSGVRPDTRRSATERSSGSWPKPARGSTRCVSSTALTASRCRTVGCASSSTRRARLSRARSS